MSNQEIKPKEHRKNSSEKDTNLNSDYQKKYLQESPNSDDNDKDKPIHFQVEYDKNKNYENQIESSPEINNKEKQSKSPYNPNKNEQDFIIEKNTQTNNNQNTNTNNNNNNKNPEYFQEGGNNLENNPNLQYYNLLKDNLNNNEIDQEEAFNNYYYYYLNNYNNHNMKNNEDDEEEPKKVKSFATRMYQGRIDPVKLKQKYNNFWKKQNKSKNKYKEKMDALKKVFNPDGYNCVTKKFKIRGMSQSRYSTRVSVNNDRPPFDNTKHPLPKSSYLIVPYDYGINDPNYGKEYPGNYDRKKMVKLRMLKKPLKYYYPYTNDNVLHKKNFKYE